MTTPTRQQSPLHIPRRSGIAQIRRAMMNRTSSQNVELWRRELLAAGWTPHRTGTMWRAPSGDLYFGPYGAWKAMRDGAR